MARLAEFLFEAMQLKRLQRSGYQFLGTGRESVAEHTFAVTLIAWVLAKMTPQADATRLLGMCLLHDLPESRVGDLNPVQKWYVAADEKKAVHDLTRGLSFGRDIRALIDEFNARQTLEARLAHDADQLAFLVDLKSLSDQGYAPASRWRDHVKKRLETPAGINLAQSIAGTRSEAWWSGLFVNSPAESPSEPDCG